MQKDKIQTIHRCFGDVSTAKDDLDYCLHQLKYNIHSNDEVLFKLRKIVDICDKVASTLEKEFEEIPK